jgi:hypothetical protein
MMKLQTVAFALSLSLATTVSALSMHQDQQVRGPDVTPPSASPHHPLFIVKYVLVREQPEAKNSPLIDLGDGRAAIRAVPLSNGQWQATLLKGGFSEPDTDVCQSWGCMVAH